MSTHRKERALFLGALRTSPWTRGPILLLRHPVVFLAIVASTAVLAIAASSGVLFVSTLDTAALEHQAVNDCAERSMPGFTADIATNNLAEGRAAMVKTMAAHGSLGTPYAVELGFVFVGDTPVNLYSRDGALAHVTKVQDAGGSGAWIPDNFVAQFNAKPGGFLTTVDGRKLRVAGVYKSLSPSPFALANIPPFFCNWQDLIIRRLVEHGTGPLVIVDEATMAASTVKSQVSVYDPIPLGSTTVMAAEEANRRGDDARNDFFTANGYAETPTITPPFSTAPVASSESLDHMIALARQSKSGVGGSVLPIDIAGAVVASLLVAGAGAYWATSRSREVRLLVSRGVSPLALSVKAVLETLPAMLIGTAVGLAVSAALVRSVGPASVFEPGTMTSAIWAAVAATVVGMVMIGVIGAIASRDKLIGGKRRWHSFAPWELVLVAVAVVLGLRLRSNEGVTIDKAIVHVSPTLVIFPLIGSLAALLLLGRVLGILLSWVRRHMTRGGTAFYLALRRITGSRAIAVGLLVCVALPGALLTYTSTITSSVKEEVTAKYRTNVGAPRVLTVIGVKYTDPELQGLGTAVVVYQATGILPNGEQSSVLGVDAQTFSRFALVDSSQRDAVKKLHPVGPGQKVPALLVNASSDQPSGSVRLGTTQLPLQVVHRSAVFPGLHVGAFPLFVVDRSALRDIDTNVSRINQVWTTDANDSAIRRVIDARGYSVLNEVTPTIVVGTTGLLPLTWIFSYLKALAIMIGMVAIAGLVFSLAARMRRRTVSYVLSRRMGLTRLGHVRSLLVELTLVVGLGFLAGVGVGSAAFRVILNSLDIYPSLPPPATFQPPRGTWAATGLVWVGVIIAATISLQVLADRARPAEILRLE